jgi:hypothetical protein
MSHRNSCQTDTVCAPFVLLAAVCCVFHLCTYKLYYNFLSKALQQETQRFFIKIELVEIRLPYLHV